MNAPGGASPGLLRAVSRWDAVALGINDVVGSGVYLLPAAAAAALGPASLWAVLLAGLAVALIVLCFAEAGSLFDQPGGAYLYTREAFGSFAGFQVGWMTWLARLATVASLTAGFAQALTAVWPGAASGWGRGLTVTAVIVLLTAINLLGVKAGTRAAVVLSIGKLLPLALLIGCGIFAISPERLTPMRVPDLESLGSVALLLLFAYAGFENTPAPAGEYRSPRRDVPFALLLTISFVTLLYTAVQLVALGVVPDLGGSQTPLADAAARLLGPAGMWLLTIGALLSILGTSNNTMLAGPRYLYALAQGGAMPALFARVHPTYRTPWVAILVQGGLALPLAASGSFLALAKLSVIARLATYIGTAAAVPVLRKKMPDAPRAIRLPGGPLIPIAALVLCLLLLASAEPGNWLAGAIALAAGVVIYRFRGSRG